MAEQPLFTQDHLESAVTELKAALPFDAMQLIRHDQSRAETAEVLRVGYEPGSAWALQHLFPRKYRVGFTERLSPHDGLPPAISSVGEPLRNDFVDSTIYRDYLRPQGFSDGISMELFVGTEYLGIAHFSTTREVGFLPTDRLAALSVRGLLGVLVRGCAAGEPSLALVDGSEFLAQSERFQEHLSSFRRSGLTAVRHLWCEDRVLYRVELTAQGAQREVQARVRRAHIQDYFRLSMQELRVMGLLVAGENDAAIAHRLHLSRRTVETHLKNARMKLGAHNRVEAVVRALTTASYLVEPETCPIETVFGISALLRS